MGESEREFQQAVLDLAGACGWWAYHTFDSRRSTPGFPDLVLAKVDRRLIVAELKTEKGRVSPAQREWLDLLAEIASDIDVCVWRPSDWPEIERKLQRAKHGRPRK
jgi:hypothetical protein